MYIGESGILFCLGLSPLRASSWSQSVRVHSFSSLFVSVPVRGCGRYPPSSVRPTSACSGTRRCKARAGHQASMSMSIGARHHALLAAWLTASAMAGSHTVYVDFSANGTQYNTTTTLQVVTSPLLDRILPNGKPNPIYDAAWQSFAELQSQHTRFQPWFPLPKKAVAELQPPDAGGTHWDFTNMMPQLMAFANATAGRAINLNVATHPCWLFTNLFGGALNCTPPASPDTLDLAYGTNGKRKYLKDKSAETLASYFARVFAFISTGQFVDELGTTHTGGPALNISRYGDTGSTWEVFNEAEHGYTKELYTHDYDKVVTEMERHAGRENLPTFIGIGGCMTGFWSWWEHGTCQQWIPYFLNRSNHALNPTVPMDYISIHYYASSSDRGRPDTYTAGFFGGADAFLNSMVENVALRDSYSPSTKLAITELGVLYANDEFDNFGLDGGLPPLFFNAAGAMYAYAAIRLAELGVDIVTHSQLIGSPARPEWGMHAQQFPSASMLDWRTGHGTAKYWVTKLLIEHFRKGDQLVTFKVKDAPSHTQVDSTLCSEIGTWTYSGVSNLTCDDPDALIDAIDFADYGTPFGTCGEYSRDSTCSTHLLTKLFVHRKCIGKRSCLIDKLDLPGARIPGIGQYGPQPCPVHELTNSTATLRTSFKVQVRCSKGGGTGSGALEYAGQKVYAVGFRRRGRTLGLPLDREAGADDERRLLLINKEMTPNNVSLVGLAAASATVYAVEPSPDGEISSTSGIITRTVLISGNNLTLLLPPFAVTVLKMQHP